MRKKFIAIILLMLVLLAACNGKSANEELESKDNEPTDIKELVYNYSVGKIKNQSASITSKQLIVTDSDDKELVYDFPEEEFFVSIAPFINETHPCENHSLTGCQGELVNQDFEDRKSTRLNSSHVAISYAVFCLKKKKSKYRHNSNRADSYYIILLT